MQVRRAEINIQTRKPSPPLVTTGLSRFSRNPIYLGMTLAYLGLTLLADSLLALVVLPLVLIFVRFGVIERGERYLEGKFDPVAGCTLEQKNTIRILNLRRCMKWLPSSI